MNKKVAIILVNWNSFSFTDQCISSLKKIHSSDSDIIVVDNGSEDNSGSQLKEAHPEIILIQSPDNKGSTGGNNLGMEYSIQKGYIYSLLLNNDTFVEADFLTILVDYMDNHPEAGAIQPKIYFAHDHTLLWNGGSYFNEFLGLTYTKGYSQKEKKQHNQLRQVDWLTSCALLTRNTILQQTGLFADNLFLYYEDTDLSFRIREKGYKLIYHPSSVIYHIAGMSNKSSKKNKEGYINPVVHYLNIRNMIWFLKRYTKVYFIPTVIIYNFFYIFLVLIYLTVRKRFKKVTAVLSAVKDGVRGKIIYSQ